MAAICQATPLLLQKGFRLLGPCWPQTQQQQRKKGGLGEKAASLLLRPLEGDTLALRLREWEACSAPAQGVGGSVPKEQAERADLQLRVLLQQAVVLLGQALRLLPHGQSLIFSFLQFWG